MKVTAQESLRGALWIVNCVSGMVGEVFPNIAKSRADREEIEINFGGVRAQMEITVDDNCCQRR